ncbi:MAG: family 43 glycosylhydrolase, partial [Duncaniella sp.]|nr:family 43 glycosylhydrolase [Duncaniella sp.]
MKHLLLAAASMSMMCVSAQNPVIHTWFTPDPAPYVHNDTVYLFTDHDEDDAQYFKMKDWQLYSTTDMVNWTYRGTPISTATFAWAKQGDNAWASQAVERDGKWYWYICAEDTTCHLHGIGVAVADSPTGPYKDALGKPLVPGAFGYIDPSVFIDDDGQAYLFWGNNGLWYARLNRDMVSLGSEVMEVPGLNDPDCFGPKVLKQDWQLNKRVMKTGYEEGPWVTKRNGIYYLAYAAGGVPEHMDYSTADNINGPWKYRGRIMDEA